MINTKKLVLMIVDDDKHDIYFFRRAIQAINPLHECRTSANGIDALSQLHATASLPDYIFLDMQMHTADGQECLIELKRDLRFRDIPVIIYSGSEYQFDMDRVHDLGAAFYLVKAMNPDDMVAEISHALLVSSQHKMMPFGIG
jgi:CheY-like chemotaxis protein